MGDLLKRRLLQTKFEGPHHEALLNLIVAANHVRGLLDEAFAGTRLTTAQYNVLRILRGAHPGGYARGEIARRVLDRAPDLTRMIDRLARMGLVERTRSSRDGRQSIARITRRGLQLLEQVQPAMDVTHERFEEQLTQREARELSRLCEKVYASAVEPREE
jgi:DNA-binding MarR family transcriptional regulator